MPQLFREIFKPAFAYLGDAHFREWIRVKSRCRNKPAGTPVRLKIAGYEVAGPDAGSFMHLYREIFVDRCFDADFKQKDPVIYCCGANIGLEIFFFKRDLPQCRIRAFEADPKIALVLEENVKNNALENVEVISAAVWTENKMLSFQSDGALGGKTGEGNTTVPALRLADELAKETKVDLLIMDIEGAELAVLNDCREQLKKVDRLFVEWHGNENGPQYLPELLQMLSACGFRYRLQNKSAASPFRYRVVENGFDAMVEIYATKGEANYE